MKWLLDLSTRTKLFLGFGLMLAFLAAVIGAAYWGINTIQATHRTVDEINFANISDVQELLRTQDDIRAFALASLLNPDRTGRDAQARQILDHTRHSDELMKTLRQRDRDDPNVMTRLDELDRLRDQHNRAWTEQLALMDQGKSEQAFRLAAGVQGERFERMQVVSDQLIDIAKDHAAKNIARADTDSARALFVLEVVGAAALAAALLMVLQLNRVFAEPLKEIARRAGQIVNGEIVLMPLAERRRDEIGLLQEKFNAMAESLHEKAVAAKQIAGGDLTVQVRVRSAEDALGNAFATMVQNLGEMAREISDAVNVLGSSCSEILAGTTEGASGAAETATAVTETAATVEQIKQTAIVSTQKAAVVSETAQKANQISQTGRAAVDETIEEMQRIRDRIEQIADSILRLSEQSQAIGEIISAVNDLSEQSNLLAVNASIEAAKAGEFGKGFGVVAQEMKNLAEQSKQATAQVRSILGDIQKATSGAVLATEQGAKAVEAGVQRSKAAGEAIRQLAASMSESAQAAVQIAASAQQQLAGMNQLALATENIKLATNQNLDSTRQTEVAAHNLHGLGQKMKELVGRYRV